MIRTSKLLALMLLAASHVAHAQPATGPTTRGAATTQAAAALQPAPTPGEALERAMHAIAQGDEAAYRRTTDVRSPHGFAEAHVRLIFASARLHKAVREHNVKAQRTRDAGFDRGRTLLAPAAPGSTEDWERTRDAIRAMQWKIEGNVARPADNPSAFEGNSSGKMLVERMEGGWVLVLADPVDQAPVEHLKQFAEGASASARAADRTAEQVVAGKLRTIAEVNDVFDAERKRPVEK